MALTIQTMRRFFQPKLVEHIPGSKRVYQNILGTKTTFQLSEESGTFDRAARAFGNLGSDSVGWQSLGAAIKLPKETPVTIKTFSMEEDRSLLDKIRHWFIDKGVVIGEKSWCKQIGRYIRRDALIDGKVVHNNGADFGTKRGDIIKDNYKKLVAKYC